MKLSLINLFLCNLSVFLRIDFNDWKRKIVATTMDSKKHQFVNIYLAISSFF